MAERRQKIRGTTAELDQVIGLSGLLAVNSEKNNLRLFDGVVMGGYEILNAAQIAALYTLPFRLTASGVSLAGAAKSTIQALENGWYFTDAATLDQPVAAAASILVGKVGNALTQTWIRADGTQMMYQRTKKTDGTWTTWQRIPDLDFLTNDPNVSAYNAARLGGELPAYYTAIAARLGYTPANKAGDTFTGVIGTTGGRIDITGNGPSLRLINTGDVNETTELYADGDEVRLVRAGDHLLRLFDTGAMWTKELGDVKDYIDTKLPLTGGTLTGPLTITGVAQALILRSVGGAAGMGAAYMRFQDSTGAPLVYVGLASTASSDFSIARNTAGVIRLDSAGGSIRLEGGQVIFTDRPSVLADRIYVGGLGAFMYENGSPYGPVWEPWGSTSAYAAINARIEARATAWAEEWTAGRQAGEVGSYGFFDYVAGSSSPSPGDTTSGSNLDWAGTGGAITSSPAGTWRCMGYGSIYTLWLRVS